MGEWNGCAKRMGDKRGLVYGTNGAFTSNASGLSERGEGVPLRVGTRDWDAEGKSTGEK